MDQVHLVEVEIFGVGSKILNPVCFDIADAINVAEDYMSVGVEGTPDTVISWDSTNAWNEVGDNTWEDSECYITVRIITRDIR